MTCADCPAPQIHVYGPVPSRRLGYSLGVDILPYKTCSLNCIYCQLGPSSATTDREASFFNSGEILAQIKETVSSGRRIDYITFSGSGEPTLNAQLGPLILQIKEATGIPVAVLTNSTLLSREPVRRALMSADLVIPSLDAVTQDVFEKINRPHPSLQIEDIIAGLTRFCREFKGAVWIEIMLVAGINDSPDHIGKLKQIIDTLRPEKVQLNTVVRPPAEDFAQALPQEKLAEIQRFMGLKSEIIADFADSPRGPVEQDVGEAILTLIKRRPATLSDLANSLGLHRNEVLKYLNLLLEAKKIKAVSHKDHRYYEPLAGSDVKK